MKTIIFSILVAVILIAGAVLLTGGSNGEKGSVNNVSVVGGKQIIEINAKGGYYPKVTVAKAGIPTTIKMATSGTFDCSSALVIPSLNYRTNLLPKGETLIDVPPQKAGTKLQGLCAMGMYSFLIDFN